MTFDKKTGRSKYDPTDQELADFENYGTFNYRELVAPETRGLYVDVPQHVTKRKLTFSHMDSSIEVFLGCGALSVAAAGAIIYAIVQEQSWNPSMGFVFLVVPMLFMFWARPRYKNVKVRNPDYNPYRINPFT